MICSDLSRVAARPVLWSRVYRCRSHLSSKWLFRPSCSFRFSWLVILFSSMPLKSWADLLTFVSLMRFIRSCRISPFYLFLGCGILVQHFWSVRSPASAWIAASTSFFFFWLNTGMALRCNCYIQLSRCRWRQVEILYWIGRTCNWSHYCCVVVVVHKGDQASSSLKSPLMMFCSLSIMSAYRSSMLTCPDICTEKTSYAFPLADSKSDGSTWLWFVFWSWKFYRFCNVVVSN